MRQLVTFQWSPSYMGKLDSGRVWFAFKWIYCPLTVWRVETDHMRGNEELCCTVWPSAPFGCIMNILMWLLSDGSQWRRVRSSNTDRAEAWSRGHWASEARLSLISWIFFCLLKLKSKHWTASGDSFWFHLKLHETGLITRVNQLDSLIDQLIIADDAQEEWITWNYRLCNWSAKPQAEHLFFLFSTIAILMF